VWRLFVAAGLLAIGIYFAIDAVIVTDRERVEEEVARLVDLAREGGPEAAEEILAALAGDYRGEGPFARERIEGHVRRQVGERRIERLLTGSYQAVPMGDDLVVPILRLQAKTRDFEANPVLRVTFAERDGRFRIVNVEQWRFER
jgi:hypothetical protein